MLAHLLASVEALSPARVVVVVGAGREQVAPLVEGRGGKVVVQEPQLGLRKRRVVQSLMKDSRSQAQAALLIRQFADPLLVIARLDLRDNRTEAAAENVNKALRLEPSNAWAQKLKRAVAAKLAEKAQPLPNP